MKNHDNPCTRVLVIEGVEVPVTQEVYLAYMQPIWREEKRQQRDLRCSGKDGHRCQDDCSTCPYRPEGRAMSLEGLMDQNFDAPDRNAIDPEAAFIKKETREELHRALDRLPERDRAIMELFGEGLSDQAIGDKIGMKQTTVSYRKRLLLKQLSKEIRKN